MTPPFAIRFTVAACTAAVLAGAAHAQSPERLYLRSLAGNCSACHAGAAREPGTIPALEGAPRDFIVSQMRAFKNGTRRGTVMPQIAKGFSDPQIQQLADWFAAQKAP